MYQYKDKLYLKGNKDICEVMAVYPGSQGFSIPRHDETVYSIMIDGIKGYFPESMVDKIFTKAIIEESKPEPIIIPTAKVLEQEVKEIITEPKKRGRKPVA